VPKTPQTAMGNGAKTTRLEPCPCDRKDSNVEMDQFDALIRQLSQGGVSRRQTMHVLAGGVLGGTLFGLAAHLGLDGSVAAKPKSKRRQEQKHNRLQTAGKRHKKHRKQRSMPQVPPQVPASEPEACPTGCTAGGGECCSDGSCVPQGQCCSSDRVCRDGSCRAQTECCADERRCGDGSCLAIDQCCPDAPPAVCGACDVQACDHGVMVCVSLEAPCVGDQHFNPQTCRCECPSGTELLENGLTCCPQAQACYFNSGRPTGCCSGGDTCVGGNLCT
jgi:hypothetical protein